MSNCCDRDLSDTQETLDGGAQQMRVPEQPDSQNAPAEEVPAKNTEAVYVVVSQALITESPKESPIVAESTAGTLLELNNGPAVNASAAKVPASEHTTNENEIEGKEPGGINTAGIQTDGEEPEASEENVFKDLPQLISRLTSRQRQVILWHYVDGLSLEEIAIRLNTEVSVARGILGQAVRSLRRKLDEIDPL